ncbi:SusD family protein [compost metagenome]
MRNSILHISISSVIAANLLLLSACNKLVQVDTPDHLVDSEVLFQSKKGYESAMAGIFIQMRALNLSMTNGGMEVYMGVSVDEIYPTLVGGVEEEFFKNQLQSSNSVVNNFWIYAYRGIYRANLLIENAERDQVLSLTDRQSFLGQALFVRAFLHFHLCQLFGDVPYISSSDYKANAVKARDSKSLVMELLSKDLERAAELLPKEIKGERVTPSYYAAIALLAKVNLYQRKFEQVLAYTDEILNNKDFMLEMDLDNVFKIKSPEVIFQIESTVANTAIAMNFIPFSPASKPMYVLQHDLLQSFETEDLRKQAWTKSNIIDGMAYYYPTKYKNKLMTPIEEYNVVFRLAEIYLIRAEALFGAKDYDQAMSTLNSLRSRAGLKEKKYGDAAHLWEDIVTERRHEFFVEGGNRWLDLIRWNTIDHVLGASKPSWQPFAKYLPIPSNEILLNTHLIQNPGYDN